LRSTRPSLQCNLLGQTALPDPGFPNKEQEATPPRARLIEAAQQLSELIVPTDESGP
jgi:hypothetical protein